MLHGGLFMLGSPDQKRKILLCRNSPGSSSTREHARLEFTEEISYKTLIFSSKLWDICHDNLLGSSCDRLDRKLVFCVVGSYLFLTDLIDRWKVVDEIIPSRKESCEGRVNRS